METSEEHIYDRADLTGAADDAWGIAREFVWGSRFPEPVMLIDYTGEDGQVTGSVGVGKTFHYLLDRLGSVVALVDSGDQSASPPVPGRIVERYTYDPYGKTLIEKPTSPGATTYTRLERSGFGNPFTWTSQRFDAATGLHAFANRMYSDTLHWLQRDPLGYVDGVSMYSYVAGRAMSATDSLGLSADDQMFGDGGVGNLGHLGSHGSMSVTASHNAPPIVKTLQTVTEVANKAVEETVESAKCFAETMANNSNPVKVLEKVYDFAKRVSDRYSRARESGESPQAAALEAIAPEIPGAINLHNAITGEDDTGRKLGDWERLADGILGAGDIVLTALGVAESVFGASDWLSSRGAGNNPGCGPNGPTCFVAGTIVATATGDRPIEELRVGDRVLTDSGGEVIGDLSDTMRGEPSADDASDWRLVALFMPNPYDADDLIEAQTLQRADWLEHAGWVVGGTIHLDMPEVGAAGPARIEAISPCPPIQNGPGHVVLTTVTHLHRHVLQIWLEGQPAPLEPTATHRLYDADRHDWIAAGRLSVGDRLLTLCGPTRIVAIEPKPGVHRVYNLEVAIEHRYVVGGARVVCHNACSDPSQIDRAAFKTEREAYWKAEAKNNPGSYAANDLARMKEGKAPIGPDGYPMELHHIDRTPEGGVVPMSRTEHRLGGNYKRNHP